MNCKQVQQLLPLYAGRDLPQKRERLIAVHLQSCAECAGAANEYDDTRVLLQEFVPPVFGEGVYAQIRSRVLAEIENESTAPAWTNIIRILFRPGWSWAVASVVLLAISVLAIYSIVNRESQPPQVAVKGGTTNQSGSNPNENLARDGQPALRPKPKKTSSDKRRDGNGKGRPDLFATNSTGVRSMSSQVTTPRNNSGELHSLPAAKAEKTLRVEIQTNDPNIRIIWFSQTN